MVEIGGLAIMYMEHIISVMDKLEAAKKDKEDLEDSPDDYRPLMLSKRSLYRVFNDTEFQTGGRFYGGWWQEIPSKYRDRITIDGKRTVASAYPVSREGSQA